MSDWKCPKCKKRAAVTKAAKIIVQIGGEWQEAVVCRNCRLAGTSARPLDICGELSSRQRSKKV